jgi:hypothetical protein
MIETGIQLPPNPYKAQFPELNLLEVGESVSYDISHRARISNAISYLQFRYNKKFTRRTDTPTTVRVWRVA